MEPKSFEKSIEEIQNLVRKLEAGDLPLEESIKEFEKGVALVQQCRKTLETAEQRVEILLSGTQDSQKPIKTGPFEE